MSRRAYWLGLLALAPAPMLAAQSATMTIPAIVRRANGAVVLVQGTSSDGATTYEGTGFLVRSDGVVVTNYHVVAHDASALVKLPNGAYFPVQGVLATDPKRDLAILKLQATGLRTLSLGNSDAVQVGETVVAIGSPLTLESSVSSGIVSGRRSDPSLGGAFLQITDPISHGSSGGPLFDLHGHVVGITTMYLEGGENLNFAIPINALKPLLRGASTQLQPLPGSNSPQPGATAQPTSTAAADAPPNPPAVNCTSDGADHTLQFCWGYLNGEEDEAQLLQTPARPAGKVSLFVDPTVNDDDTVGAALVYTLKNDIATSAVYALAPDATSADFAIDVVAVAPDTGLDTAGAMVVECSGAAACAGGLALAIYAFDVGGNRVNSEAQDFMGDIDQAISALPMQKQ